jgi:hypothetical protein
MARPTQPIKKGGEIVGLLSAQPNIFNNNIVILQTNFPMGILKIFMSLSHVFPIILHNVRL